MASFRGDDETLEREISTLEAIARLRLRRMTHELNDLDRDLKSLKAELARRRARSRTPAAPETAMARA